MRFEVTHYITQGYNVTVGTVHLNLMTDDMMNIVCEDGSGPSGIELEGASLSKGSMVKDRLLKKCPCEVPNSNRVETCHISNTPSIVSNDTMAELVHKPFVGMEFDTIDASHKFWELYAQNTGFCARIRSTSRRTSDRVIRTRTYVCSKEGKRCEDQRPDYSKRRSETRCDCGVMMTVSLVRGKGVYWVASFIGEHNHELESKINAPLLTDIVGSAGLECSLDKSTTMQGVNKPVLGMEFDTLEASQAFWEQYACNVGFSPRIRSTSKNKSNGVVRTRAYVCSKEGRKSGDLHNINCKRLLDTRCGCGVLMTISLVKEKGTYRVVTFVEQHNHGLDDKQSTPRLKKPRKSTDKSQRRVFVETPARNLTKAQAFGINHRLDREDDSQARKTVFQNGAVPAVLEGSLPIFMNGYRMGILCAEFMQLAYRAVGSDEVFEGVRRLIREGHSLADRL